jgi:hypothetical protein
MPFLGGVARIGSTAVAGSTSSSAEEVRTFSSARGDATA